MSLSAFKKAFKLLIPSILILSALAISYFRIIDNFEFGTLDLRFFLRPVRTVPEDKIAIIEIGDDTVAKLGRFPFDRNYHAIVIAALSEFGAKAIVFDVLFGSHQEHDAELGEAVAQSGRVYLPSAFDIESSVKSDIITARGYASECLPDLAAKARGTGHINVVPDSDGKFRRVPTYIKYNDKLYPNLSFLAACDYLGIDRSDVKFCPGKYINCGKDITIPLDERSEMIVNYSGKWSKAFRHYSFVDVMQSYLAPAVGEKPILKPDYFKDKVCIIGVTTIGIDIHSTPFESVYPGVGIHAEIFDSIVNKNFIARASRWINLAILIFLSIVITLITFIEKPAKGFMTLVFVIFFFIAACLALFDLYGLWLDMVFPIFIMVLLYLSLTLYRYISEWKNRLKSEYELGTARTIQESFLPKSVPDMKGVEVRAVMFTARQVGGDLFEFIKFDEERLGVMIGDVSGKGIPASLFMAMIMGEFRSLNFAELAPSEVLFRLNAKLVRESRSDLFVTMFYAIFDLKNKSVDFANGGHLPLLYISKAGRVEFLDVAEGTPLGLIEGDYSRKTMPFDSGDIFLFYTDGVTEAMNRRREMYGKERLVSVVEKSRGLPTDTILDNIEKDIRRFEPKSTQHDDITVIVVKIQ